MELDCNPLHWLGKNNFNDVTCADQRGHFVRSFTVVANERLLLKGRVPVVAPISRSGDRGQMPAAIPGAHAGPLLA